MRRLRFSPLVVLAGLLSAWPVQALDFQDVGVESRLAQPGTALVVVYFHASWCKGCNDLGPAFARVLAEFASFREIEYVSVSGHEEVAASCAPPSWLQGGRDLCDLDGSIGRSLGVTGMPAFLAWSWQGKRVFTAGDPEQLREGLRRFVQQNPRLTVQAADANDRADPVLADEVRAALTQQGKMVVVADPAKSAALARARQEQDSPAFAEEHRCRPGALLPASILVDVKRRSPRHLVLQALDIERGHIPFRIAAKPSVEALVEAFVQSLRHRLDAPDSPSGGAPTPPALIELRSDPPGASVRIDEAEVCLEGETPCKRTVTAGRHRVEMRLAGHRSLRTEITFACGMNPVYLRLTDGIRPPPAPEVAAPVEMIDAAASSRGLRPAHWAGIAGGASTAAGATLLWVSSQSRTSRDDQYQQYRDSGFPVDSHALAQARRLDDRQVALTLGGTVLLGVGAAGLSWLLWDALFSMDAAP